jgi:cell wall-associated NlpC family hydrolase
MLDSEALFGEPLSILKSGDEWSMVRLAEDGYEGFVPSSDICKSDSDNTHKVVALRTPIYPKPDIKSPHLGLVSLNSQLSVIDTADNFLHLADGQYIFSGHVAPLEEYAQDFVDVAISFVGTPYIWGGRQSLGIDCSGLVQMALLAAGIKSPRDSSEQCMLLGRKLEDGAALQRGDLIFWAGHVGIMVDHTNLLHANAYHMQTAIEPLAVATKRISATSGTIIARKRVL